MSIEIIWCVFIGFALGFGGFHFVCGHFVCFHVNSYWIRSVSSDLTALHLIWFELIPFVSVEHTRCWLSSSCFVCCHLIAFDVVWFHVSLYGVAWVHLRLFHLNWFYLCSFDVIRCYLISRTFIWFLLIWVVSVCDHLFLFPVMSFILFDSSFLESI